MNNSNHSYDDIYFKHFLKSSHRRSKIDIVNFHTPILMNAGMILIGFIVFSIISSDAISIKLNAYNEDNDSYAKVSANNNQYTNISTTTTSIKSTEKAQETLESTHNTEVTTSVISEELYGIVNTKKDPLNVRILPSIESDLLTKIPKGTAVTIISEEGDWFKVRYSNIEGYVSKQYILFGDDNITIEENDSQNNIIGIVITENDPLNVRISPSIESQKIGTVPKGGQVSIIAENGDWYEIEYNNSTGFVYKKYIRLQD